MASSSYPLDQQRLRCATVSPARSSGSPIAHNHLYVHVATEHDRGRVVSHWSQNANQVAHNARNLILVACHGVAISGHLEDADRDEHDWYLLPYQKHRGIPQAIVAHISAGIEVALRDQHSILMFSGGETRSIAGPESEGSSYYRVADAMGLWPAGSDVRARTISEDFATDSFENLYVTMPPTNDGLHRTSSPLSSACFRSADSLRSRVATPIRSLLSPSRSKSIDSFTCMHRP